MQNGAGIVEPRITLDVAIAGLRSVADGAVDSNPYFQAFESKLADIASLSDTERDDLLAAARTAVGTSVIPAHQSLRTRLQSLQANAPRLSV